MNSESSGEELKQVIIVRNDLHMPNGKLAAQASHASLDAALKTDREILNEWHNSGGKKVVLKVETEKELLQYFMLAKKLGLVAVLISDAGRTFLQPGTKTCVGIGPDLSSKIDAITGSLQML
ncbi:MAG: peptidyl-tRNA hydrolase Pth2 [Candidatus Woesearchaeota archaeon]|nr:peptidyl-tRNA hydrolase Pth2 [Candidatus Woesearchaeota archaeon]